MSQDSQVLPGTIVWIGPFYNRSGYGIGARAIVSSLHRAGARIRVVSVDEVESGIDDSDLDLIKSLETTPLIPPITAIVSHVPHVSWLNIKLPEPSLRIIATTFDSSAQGNVPPAEWMKVINGMDQLWLASDKERETLLSTGIPSDKIQLVYWPHHWLENPSVPPSTIESYTQNKPFRFLSIAMYLPRRRWDALIEAYLEEFKNHENVELYLKVNYPSWHPVPGKPRQDLHELIRTLRQKTGSRAAIIIDEDLGTRLSIVQLIDSCNVYISTDTASTAPISESRVRRRLVILPEGLGIMPQGSCVEIAVDPAGRSPMTPDMLLYQPHHKDTFMPLLNAHDVRNAMRCAFNMPLEERQAKAANASGIPGPAETVPAMINAINAGWRYKEKLESEKKAKELIKRVIWEGSQFVHHSLALINRELCLRLIDAGYEVSIISYENHEFGPESDSRFEKIAQRLDQPLQGKADVHIRHKWPPDFTPPIDGHWVMIQPWEFGSLPQKWVGPMSTQLDEMWVPSTFVRECYIRSGVPAERVFVVPNGVDVDRFNPEAAPIKLTTKKNFKFLFVGGTIGRKGIDILLNAYTSAFTSADDVCLVIKDMGGQTFYKGQTAGQMLQEYQSIPNTPEIEYIDRMLNDEELAGLYRACDCLVHPYRGEGFGLPIAEAMASGLPVIVTGYGAALDFCPEAISYLIPAKEVRLPEKRIGDMETVDFPWLAEPDQIELVRLMKHVVTHQEEAADKGRQAAAFIRANFSWENAAEAIMDRINHIQDKPIVRFSLNEETAPEGASPETENIADLLRIGEDYFSLGELGKAVAAFKRILELDSRNTQALNNLGVIQWQLGDKVSAMDIFHTALSFNPRDPDSLANLLQAATETGRFDLINPKLLDMLKQSQPANPDIDTLIEALRRTQGRT